MGLNMPRSTGDLVTFAVNFSLPLSPETPVTSEEHAAPAAPGVTARVLLAGVRGYQWLVSPALHALAGPGAGCRFSPSCSHYACEALLTHGAISGTVLAARRILRCNPWGPSGADPVPPRPSSCANEARSRVSVPTANPLF